MGKLNYTSILCCVYQHPILSFSLSRWTGSNTNPNNNDGQGRAGTDRSNMVLLRPPNYPEGDSSAGPAVGHWGNSYPALLDTSDNSTLLGLSREDRENLATLVNCESSCVFTQTHTHTYTHIICTHAHTRTYIHVHTVILTLGASIYLTCVYTYIWVVRLF